MGKTRTSKCLHTKMTSPNQKPQILKTLSISLFLTTLFLIYPVYIFITYEEEVIEYKYHPDTCHKYGYMNTNESISQTDGRCMTLNLQVFGDEINQDGVWSYYDRNVSSILEVVRNS